MNRHVSNEDLMRYLDGELPPEARARVDAELERSTELQRELAIYRALQSGFRDLSFAIRPGTSVWDRVDRRITRPIGWMLFVMGSVLWAGHGIWVFETSAADPWEKLAVSALLIGFLILLGSTIFERIREERTDPYRDIER